MKSTDYTDSSKHSTSKTDSKTFGSLLKPKHAQTIVQQQEDNGLSLYSAVGQN